MFNDNHIIFTGCKEINKIIKPFKQYGIDFLIYVKVYTNGSRISLNSNLDWSKQFHEEFFMQSPKQSGIFEHTVAETFFQLWNSLDNHAVNFSKEKFGYTSGIDLFVPGHDYTEIYSFASRQNKNSMDNLFLNNLDGLRKAALFFTSSAKDILISAEKEGIILPEASSSLENEDGNSIIKSNHTIEIPSQKFHLNGKFSGIQLTIREYQCLTLLKQYGALKPIARALNISDRTVVLMAT